MPFGEEAVAWSFVLFVVPMMVAAMWAFRPRGGSVRGVQPVGSAKPYPPPPVPIVKKTATACAFCDTPITPGATLTSCSNCGAPITPLPFVLRPRKSEWEDASGRVQGHPDCLEWSELRGDNQAIAKVCSRWKVPPPGPPSTIYGIIPNGLDDLPVGEPNPIMRMDAAGYRFPYARHLVRGALPRSKPHYVRR